MDTDTKEPMTEGYNERLFSGRGIRSYIHHSRFRWLGNVVKSFHIDLSQTFELGCFDGRALDWLPTKPERYLGVDAGWEGGIELGYERFRDDRSVQFLKSEEPNWSIPDQPFTLSLALETLEHLEPETVDSYLKRIAKSTNGYFVVTVPNELGPVFLSKWCYKRLFYGDHQDYSSSELVNAFLGRLNKVKRDDHKGFDYRDLVSQIGQYFDIQVVQGLPGPFGPLLSVTVGIVAHSR